MQERVCDRWGTQTTAIDIAEQNSEVTVPPPLGGGGFSKEGGYIGIGSIPKLADCHSKRVIQSAHQRSFHFGTITIQTSTVFLSDWICYEEIRMNNKHPSVIIVAFMFTMWHT